MSFFFAQMDFLWLLHFAHRYTSRKRDPKSSDWQVDLTVTFQTCALFWSATNCDQKPARKSWDLESLNRLMFYPISFQQIKLRGGWLLLIWSKIIAGCEMLLQGDQTARRSSATRASNVKASWYSCGNRWSRPTNCGQKTDLGSSSGLKTSLLLLSYRHITVISSYLRRCGRCTFRKMELENYRNWYS